MTMIWINLELVSLVLFVVFGLICGSAAAKLKYRATERELRRKSGRLLVLTAFAALFAGLVALADLMLASSADPLFWRDRLLLRAPLAVLPVAVVLAAAVPRLRRLRGAANGGSAAALDSALRAQAAHPYLVAPYPIAALGGLTALYFGLAAPLPAWPTCLAWSACSAISPSSSG